MNSSLVCKYISHVLHRTLYVVRLICIAPYHLLEVMDTIFYLVHDNDYYNTKFSFSFFSCLSCFLNVYSYVDKSNSLSKTGGLIGQRILVIWNLVLVLLRYSSSSLWSWIITLAVCLIAAASLNQLGFGSHTPVTFL